MTTFVEIHLIQTVPPSCLNRDDTGTPKSAIYGGTERARVSSQSWKRAARNYFREHIDADKMGVRTKELPRLVADRAMALDSSLGEADALRLAVEVLDKAGLKVKVAKPKKGEEAGDPVLGALAFLSGPQILDLAHHVVAAAGDESYLASAAGKIKADVKDANSIDVALFGRMVADDKGLNVDAACQVAHALGVAPNAVQYDFFTAMDDHKSSRDDSDAGGAMMGTVEFTSATMYRYAVVDVDALSANLDGHESAVEAVTLFTEAFVRSLPTGRQNTFAAHTPPALVHVVVRTDQPISLVGAFEKALTGEDIEARAIKELLAKQERVERMYGSTPQATFTASEEAGSLSEVIEGLRAELS